MFSHHDNPPPPPSPSFYHTDLKRLTLCVTFDPLGSARRVFMPEADAAAFFKSRGRRSTRYQAELHGEGLLLLLLLLPWRWCGGVAVWFGLRSRCSSLFKASMCDVSRRVCVCVCVCVCVRVCVCGSSLGEIWFSQDTVSVFETNAVLKRSQVPFSNGRHSSLSLFLSFTHTDALSLSLSRPPSLPPSHTDSVVVVVVWKHISVLASLQQNHWDRPL